MNRLNAPKFVCLVLLLMDCARLMFQIVGYVIYFVVFFALDLHVVFDKCIFVLFSWY